MNQIYVTGVSGNGKSALIKEFTKMGITAFDIDEVEGLCSWVNSITGEKNLKYEPNSDWLKNHEWICDEEKLKEILNKYKDQNLIITGFSSNQDSYINLFTKVFLLQSPKEVFLKRIENRYLNSGENRFGRHDFEREFIENVFEKFEKRVLSQGAIAIDSNRPLNTVAEEVILKSGIK